MYDFVPVDDSVTLHVRVRDEYQVVTGVLKEFAEEADLRDIGTVSGPTKGKPDGWVFLIHCNVNKEHAAMMFLAFCGINELDYEVEYERQDFRRILKERFIPLQGELSGKKSWDRD